MSKKIVYLAMIFLVAFSFLSQAGAALLVKSEQQQILEKLITELKQNYLEQAVAADLSNLLEKEITNLNEEPVDPVAFATTISQKLQQQSDDLHLRVEYFPGHSIEPSREADENDFATEGEKQMWQSKNMGFKKVEKLPFNIGLIQLDAFAPANYASPLIAASFNFVSYTDALVIDLRGNFGGYEYTAPLFASYLLSEKTHLFSMYQRNINKLEERWSFDEVAGTRYQNDKPVYILVDKETFSAGEALAYTLKHLGRATIVGEQTAGASNAGKEFVLNDSFIAFIPTKKMINPVTQTNFEGKGVMPDVKASSAEALAVAQRIYLENLLSLERSEKRKVRISRRIQALEQNSQ